MKKSQFLLRTCAFLALLLMLLIGAASAQDAPKPNILVIMGDDIGMGWKLGSDQGKIPTTKA